MANIAWMDFFNHFVQIPKEENEHRLTRRHTTITKQQMRPKTAADDRDSNTLFLVSMHSIRRNAEKEEMMSVMRFCINQIESANPTGSRASNRPALHPIIPLRFLVIAVGHQK